jgi:two-component system chemotaxis response regulator CheB
MNPMNGAAPRKLQTLVVDDTALYRRAVSDALAGIEGLEVSGTASNGRLALARLEELRPDLMTLDIEMPELNGIEVLQALASWPNKPAVIVLSSHTMQGGALTMKALELGAFDFVTKPEGGSMEKSLESLRRSLSPVIQAYALRSNRRQPASASAPLQVGSTTRVQVQKQKKLVVIGVSTGGPQALARLLPSLPTKLDVPILIVQHMPPLFTQALAESLSRKCSVPIREAVDNEYALPGTVYIAPGGKHLKVKAGPAGEVRMLLTEDPPENHCRPAVDYLFRSVALQFPSAAVGVILTGMGNDGAQGLRQLKKTGCPTMAQDEASSVVFGMPREAIAAGGVDEVLPLSEIAEHILLKLEEGRRA